ncbi:DUF1573 domain-containing protein [bacterium]|nr:DUF1573 domain-containing protein [bacterium]
MNRMVKTIVCFLGMLCLILGPGAMISVADEISEAETSPGPIISFEQKDMIYDLGLILPDQTIEISIIYDNQGADMLRVWDVQGSSGCTASLLSSDIIMPGEMGEIKVIVTSDKKVGQLMRNVSMRTNDPKHARVTLAIRAQVVVDYVLVPNHIAFGRLTRTELNGEKYARVKGDSAHTYSLKQVVSSSPFMNARILEANEYFPVQRLLVRLNEAVPLGRFQEEITVATDNPDFPEMSIQVSAYIMGHIIVKPAQVFFRVSAAQPQKPVEQEISLYNPQKRDFTILSSQILPEELSEAQKEAFSSSRIDYIEPREDDLELKVGQPDPQGQCLIKLIYLKRLQPNQRSRGTLRLLTDDPDQPHVDIPFLATTPLTKVPKE